MTDAEAKEMLAALEKHFKQPVKPIAEYCAALELWAGALRDRAQRKRADLYPGIEGGFPFSPGTEAVLKRYEEDKADGLTSVHSSRLAQLRDYEHLADQVNFVFLQIRKSNLLARLLYAGETLRTIQCPVHKGQWSGCAVMGDNCMCQRMQSGEVGIDITGWLP